MVVELLNELLCLVVILVVFSHEFEIGFDEIDFLAETESDISDLETAELILVQELQNKLYKRIIFRYRDYKNIRLEEYQI